MKAKKITIKAVRDAYKNTEIVPVIGETVDSYKCMACPIAVLYFDAHSQSLACFKKERTNFRGKPMGEVVFDWATKEFGEDYIAAFVDGVDGGRQYMEGSEANKGFKEGRDILKSLKLKGH